MYFQWLGDDDLRHKMQGRLILVHLMCRDMALISREALLSAASGSGMFKTQRTVADCPYVIRDNRRSRNGARSSVIKFN